MDKENVFSQTIKAGKRIYYLDVKRSRNEEMFLTITESKKIVTGEGEGAQTNYEKHKLFLYREDMENFVNGLLRAVEYIRKEQGLPQLPRGGEKLTSAGENAGESEEIKIDIEF